jgi:histidine ammonia-lyase
VEARGRSTGAESSRCVRSGPLPSSASSKNPVATCATRSTSQIVEVSAPLPPQAVTLTRRALTAFDTILAIEVLVAISALDDRARAARLGRATQRVYDAVHATLERLDAGASAATVVEVIRRRLLEAAERRSGPC